MLSADLPNHAENDLFRVDVFRAPDGSSVEGLPEFSSLNHVGTRDGTSLSYNRSQLAALFPTALNIASGPLAVRFSGQFFIEAAGFTVFDYVDGGGARLLVDGRPLANSNSVSGTTTGSLHLEPGWHEFRLERVESGNSGTFQLRMRQADQTVLQIFGSSSARLNAGLIADLTPLSQLGQLTYLSLANQAVADLTPLAALRDPLTGQSRLRSVDLQGNQVRDLSPLAGIYVIDAGDFGKGYSERVGRWTSSGQGGPFTQPIAGAFEGDHRQASRTTGQFDDATWTFSNLLPGMPYDVLATWSAGEEHAFTASYRVVGQEASTVLANQSLTPRDDFVLGSQRFQKLVRAIADSNGTLRVHLNSAGSGRIVVADAVVVRQATAPQPRLTNLNLTGNPLDNRSLAILAPQMPVRQAAGFALLLDNVTAPMFASTIENVAITSGLNTLSNISSQLGLLNAGAVQTLVTSSLGSTEILRYRLGAPSTFEGVEAQLRYQPRDASQSQTQPQPHFSDGKLLGGMLFVTDSSNSRVLKINQASGKVMAWRNISGGALDVAATEQHIYVLKNTGVAQLDLNLNVVNANFITGLPFASQGALEIGPGGDLYLAQYTYTALNNGSLAFTDNSVRRYNAATGAFVSTFIAASHPQLNSAVDLASDGTSLFVVNMALDGSSYNVLQYSAAGVFQNALTTPINYSFVNANARPRVAMQYGPGISGLYLSNPVTGFIGPVTFSGPVIPPGGLGGLTSATFLAFENWNERSHFHYDVISSDPRVTGYVDANDALRLSVGSGITTPVSIRLRAYDAAEGYRGNYAEFTLNAHVNSNAIYGTVYEDRDRDNVRDAGENGLAGVRVEAVSVATGNTLASVHTDASGRYTFSGLPSESISIRVAAAPYLIPGQPALVPISTSTWINNLLIGAYRVLNAGPNLSWPEGSLLTLNANPTHPEIAYTINWVVRDATDTVTLASGSTATLQFMPPDQGQYIARFGVVDPVTGLSYTDRVDIFATAVPANFDLGEPVTMAEGRFTRTIAFNDPGDESYDILIDYGDGSPVVELVNYTQPEITLNHIYRQVGNFIVRLTLTNHEISEQHDEPTLVRTLPITITNSTPVISSANFVSPLVEGGPATLAINIDEPSGYIATDGNGWTVTVDWGDGQVETFTDFVAQNGVVLVAHVYRDDGDYTIAIVVRDEDGDEATFQLSASVANAPPELFYDGQLQVQIPTTAREGEPLQFSANARDPGQDSLTYRWLFNEGQMLRTGAQVSHTFIGDGLYSVSLTITDDDGASIGPFVWNIQVDNVPPSLTPAANRTAIEGSVVTFEPIAILSDPGILTETYTLEIDWGDGQTSSFGPASVTQFNASHTYANDGIYIVRLRVLDSDGGSSDVEIANGDLDGNQIVVTVGNAAPVLSPQLAFTPQSQQQLVYESTPFAFRFNFTDAAGWIDNTFAESYSYTVNWGDGTQASGTVSNLELDNAGQTRGYFDAGHNYAQDGLYQVAVTLVDSDGGTTTRQYPLKVFNQAPQLNLDQYPAEILQGTTLRFTGSFSDTATDDVAIFVNLGDGIRRRAVRSDNQFSFQHHFDQANAYVIEFIAEDRDGGRTIQTAELAVLAEARITLAGDAHHHESDTDAYQLTLSQLYTSTSVVGAIVNWGDGSSTVLNASQFVAILQGGNVTLEHVYDDDRTVDGQALIAVSLVRPDQSTFVVSVKTVTVANVAPTATLANSGVIYEGSTAIVTVMNIIEPSAADRRNLRFSYDFNNDGDFNDVGDRFLTTLTSLAVPSIYLVDEGNHTVRVRISDDEGGYTDLFTTIVVQNVTPTLNVGGPGVAHPGRLFTREITIDDPGLDNPWTIRVDWNGDGDFDDPLDQTFTTESRELEISQLFDATFLGSVLTVSVLVSDVDGAVSQTSFELSVLNADTTAPGSTILALPNTATSLDIPIIVEGLDPPGDLFSFVSGIDYFQLYVSEDTGPFVPFAIATPAAPSTVFRATSNRTYFFRSLAVDHAGNVESKPVAPDTQIRVGDLDAPTTQVVSAEPNESGLFTVQITGSDTGGGTLRFIDLYVSVDGWTAELVSSTAGGLPDVAGNYAISTTYQGRTDGVSHTYRFFSIGRDSAGNVESTPNHALDLVATHLFAPQALMATGIDVQLSVQQRSYIQYVDVLFNQDHGLAELLLLNPIRVERFALDATDVTPGTGVAVNGYGVSKVGDRLRLDWGLNGVTGNRTSNAGDGLYRVMIDGNADGDYEDAVDRYFEFARILGDANGDAQVDDLDIALINAQFGRIGANLNGDIDGSYFVNPGAASVNTLDRNLATAQKNLNRRLSDPLRPLLDD